MIKKLATAGTAVALAAVTLLPGGVAAAATDTVEAKASKGTLGWGVKESFRGYIEGPVADGAIEVAPPAVRKADGTFVFKKGRGNVDVDAESAVFRFKGEVYFYGHDEGTGPLLELYIEKPRVVIKDGSGVLVADVTSRGFSGEGLVEYPGVELVTVDVSGLDLKATSKGVVKVGDLPTALTGAGAEAFAGFYPAGTAFDPISFKVKLKG